MAHKRRKKARNKRKKTAAVKSFADSIQGLPLEPGELKKLAKKHKDKVKVKYLPPEKLAFAKDEHPSPLDELIAAEDEDLELENLRSKLWQSGDLLIKIPPKHLLIGGPWKTSDSSRENCEVCSHLYVLPLGTCCLKCLRANLSFGTDREEEKKGKREQNQKAANATESLGDQA